MDNKENRKKKIKEYNRLYYIKNRNKILERVKKYQKENPEKMKKKWRKENEKRKESGYGRIHQWLYGHKWAKSDGFLNGDGLCILCGEINPLFLLTHHPFGRKINDFTITVCGNCHRLIKRMGQGWIDKWGLRYV